MSRNSPRKGPNAEWLHLLAYTIDEGIVPFLESVVNEFPYLLGDVVAVLWQSHREVAMFYLDAVHFYDPNFQSIECRKTAYTRSLVDNSAMLPQIFPYSTFRGYRTKMAEVRQSWMLS